jgi:hypothetical protein
MPGEDQGEDQGHGDQEAVETVQAVAARADDKVAWHGGRCPIDG